MINLNLINDSTDTNPVYEYFKNDLPAKFLADIRNINVMVGANNSRKSRFLRNVLSLEQIKMVKTDTDLNVLIHEGASLADQVNFLNENGIGGSLISMRTFAPDNELGKILAAYFDEIKEPHRNLNAGNISALINGINKLILQLSDSQPMELLRKKAVQLETACELILYLYKYLQTKGDKMVAIMSYPDGPFRHMEPTVPGVKSQSIVPFVDQTIRTISALKSWVEKLRGIEFEVHRKNNIYIPVLRTSRSLSGSSGDVFSDTLKKQHFNDKLPAKLEIETGLKLYEKINYARNGTSPERKAFTEFEHFIGMTFFKSKDIYIVAHADRSGKDRTIRISVPGQKEDVPIYDLGDGVQGIINLLFPIFTAGKGDWVFIDEPENHLHPGYQNIFMRAIGENEFLKQKGLRYFINTHSNHVLSEAFLSPADSSIFVFSNRDSNSSNIFAFNQDHYSTLELLGVMNTSVFITNCTIWVEGITDRFYMRAFLHAYCQTLDNQHYRPNEGFDFSFVEYAGKNLVHYDFNGDQGDNIASYFLNSNVFLLADSDFDKEKHKRYEQIDRPNFSYHKTEVPEIENLIPEAILKAFLVNELGCDKDSVLQLRTIGPNVKLGQALEGITRKAVKVPIQAKYGGTLNPYYKSKLSKYVYNQILSGNISWDELSSSKRLKEIILSLYKFIQSRNGK
jgi:hypothetical protein